MSIQGPKIDLSNVKYDALETALTEMLGLKVILIRDWETPDEYYRADSMRVVANMYETQERKDQAQQEFHRVENTVLGSLRANIAERDPAVGSDLSENELRSLQKVGHVTLRKGNAEPEEAVIIFDPGSASRRFPEKNPALQWALGTKFSSAWRDEDADHKKIDVNVEGFVENFDIKAEDIRRYQAVMNARYALQNQNEYNNKDKGWYYQPWYYNFAALADSSPGMYESNASTTFARVAKKLEMEDSPRILREIGIQDPDFIEKLKLAGAIKNLVYSMIPPLDTFARLGTSHCMTPQQVHEIQQDLHERLKAKLKDHRDGKEKEGKRDIRIDYFGLDDWRILFPVFREVYQEDKSTGDQRRYLDTIMTGLQKWFPTLTNGPVPDLDVNKEPPRSIPKLHHKLPKLKP